MAIGRAVGVIFTRRPWWRLFEKQYLVEYRLCQPIGLALVAGHVEDGETWIKAIWREGPEETGMSMFLGKEVYRSFIPGDCKRCGGGHDWRVYEAKAIGQPRIMEPAKHAFVKYMAVREMRPYIESGRTDPAWFNFILPALGILPAPRTS